MKERNNDTATVKDYYRQTVMQKKREEKIVVECNYFFVHEKLSKEKLSKKWTPGSVIE